MQRLHPRVHWFRYDKGSAAAWCILRDKLAEYAQSRALYATGLPFQGKIKWMAGGRFYFHQQVLATDIRLQE